MSRQLREFRRGLVELKASRIEPCLPSPAAKPPSGPGWLHEIKYDGFRMMVRREAGRIQVLTRNGHDWTARFPLIVAATETIKARGFLIDGEAVVCDESGDAYVRSPSIPPARCKRLSVTVRSSVTEWP